MIMWLRKKFRVLRHQRAKMSIFALLASVITLGSLSFYMFERGSGGGVNDIWDAVYWVFVTITTVGFGDIVPRTAGGRITFVLVALGGIGTIAYVFEEIISVSTTNQFKKMFGLGAIKMKNHTIIAGWNTKAEEAISELNCIGEEHLVVGLNLDQAQLNAAGVTFVAGDPTKSEVLLRCHILQAKTLLIPLENDSETIMVALAARRLNRNIKIVATCDLREHVEVMRVAGIDHVIPHTELGGRLIVHAINEPVVVNFIMDATASGGGLRMRQVAICETTKLSDIPISDLERVVSLYRGEQFSLDFTPDQVLERGDFLVILTSVNSCVIPPHKRANGS